ncbi:MAG TPA: VWA domain-containing protein [Candidatus Angelobacter sp.]|nr:VWA domain-containing protein [Candidatus Angelobacter sp.]
MRAATVGVLLVLSVVVVAQNNPPGQSTAKPAPTPLRATTRLVVLDVVAVDEKGQPVTGLKAEDFTVTEDGAQQAIADFSFHSPGAFAQSAPRAGIVTNAPQFSGHSCLNVILLDAINTDFSNHAYAQDQLVKFLDTNPAIQPTAVYALEGNLKLLHDFTTDTRALREVLAHYKSLGPTHLPTVEAAASPFERRGTFQPVHQGRSAAFYAMSFLAEGLGGYPGRKNLIWISDGFPLNLFPDALMADQAVLIEDFSPAMEKIADDLMEAQIAVYPVSAAGVSQVDQFNAQTAMSSLAQRTGGKTFFNRNDIDTGVRVSLDDGATYYTLEYYPQNKKWDQKFRHIQVKLVRPGVKLQYRDGYYARNPVTPYSENIAAQQLSNALSINAPAATAVIFKAAIVQPSATTQNKLVVNFAVDAHTVAFQRGADDLQHASLSCIVWAYPGKGDPVRSEGTSNAALKEADYQQLMQSYFPCQRSLELKPGQYTLRLGVIDQSTNLFGTSTAQVTVP